MKERSVNNCRSEDIKSSWLQINTDNLTFTLTNHRDVQVVNETQVFSNSCSPLLPIGRAPQRYKNATAASCTERGGKRNSWLAKANHRYADIRQTDRHAHLSTLVSTRLIFRRAGADANWTSDKSALYGALLQVRRKHRCLKALMGASGVSITQYQCFIYYKESHT